MTGDSSPPGMLRALVRPNWLRWVALACLYAVAAYFLGNWQWGKYQVKAHRAQLISAAHAALPVPIETVLAGPSVPPDREWTHVTATGRYTGRQLFVRNRPNDGTYGYEVLAPLQLADGPLLLIGRGWVPNSAGGAAVLPPVPPLPSGQVQVTGWLRRGEPSLNRSLPANQLATINLPEAAAQLNAPLIQTWVQTDFGATTTPKTNAGTGLRASEDPDTSIGINVAYAVQWWLSIPAPAVFVYLRARRELMDSAGPTRPKRVRIWDEEDA